MIERFLAKVRKTETCWLWKATGSRYGYFRVNGTALRTNRVSYTLFKGEIPAGMHVLHTCDVTLCVNPDHLFLGTHQDNMVDRDAKGRCGAGKHLLARTHCRRGHLYEGQNLSIRIDGSRSCKECTNMLARDRRKKYNLSNRPMSA